TFDVRIGVAELRGLFAVDDTGDRGDSYDADPVPGGVDVTDVRCTRRRHPSGIAEVEVTRVLRVPVGLTDDRAARSEARVPMPLTIVARLAPGVPRVDLRVRVENHAMDHRLRLRIPTGRPCAAACAATTFGVATRAAAPHGDAGWVHPAPRTFPHQGWVSAN